MDEAYFYSLVGRKGSKGERSCLRCGVKFESSGFHNRNCGSCNSNNKRASLNSTYAIWEHKKNKI